MNVSYRTFFGFKKEPYGADLELGDILKTPELLAVKERFDYTLRIGAMALVTGDIGSGKSTALRYAMGQLHPSEYNTLYITASSGSILELYRQLLAELGFNTAGTSKVVMTRLIKKEIQELVLGKKMKAALIIDEASLIRLDVFAELHTITQFEGDSKPYLPIILAGQSNLIDKLIYRTSQPLASRIVARSHLEGVNLKDMEQYLEHHLSIAGIHKNLFDPSAITAIHQGSGGLFRKANHLARGALIAAAKEKSMAVSAEHVRLASTEVF
ncbi:MAG TPA: AAA family ATPase [Desulfobacteraceae bacterium]|nr:AAA family ATPase [Desulfobacteraceae bacterium]